MAHAASETAGRPIYTFEQSHPADRMAVGVAIGLCWFDLLAGFIPDMLRQFNEGHAYVPAAHIHAASAWGWMMLLTWQAFKVRNGDIAGHRRNGKRFAPILAPIVVISALVTIWTADRAAAATNPAYNPARLAFQIGHIVPFAVLTVIGLLRTGRPDLHKRLMLLAVFAILDTGMFRWLSPGLKEALGPGPALEILARFPLTWALMAGMALFDIRTRGRVHPAFAAAAALILVTEFGAAVLFYTPGWTPVARSLLGI